MTAPRFPGRQAKKEATAEKVKAAAKALFDAGGYETATIRKIADAAKVSTGAIFGNFIDKAELWAAIYGPDIPVPGDSNLHRNSIRMLLQVIAMGDQFRFYERQHRAKGTVESAQKADVNAAWAANCEALVAACNAPLGDTPPPFTLAAFGIAHQEAR